MRWLIDDILPNRNWSGLGVLTALFCIVSIGRVVLGSIGNMVNALGVMRFTARMRRRLLDRLLGLPASFYAEKPVGDLVQRMESDVSAVADFGADILPSAAQMTLQSVMTIGVMLFLDWRLTVIVLPLAPLFEWLRKHYSEALRERSERAREATGQESSLLNELLSGATQIQLLGAERRMGRRYFRLTLRALRAKWKQRTTELAYSITTMSVVSIGSALIIGYGGARVLSGSLTAGSLVAFYGYVGGIFLPLMTATELYARVNRVRANITRLLEIEQVSNTIADRPDALPLIAAPSRIAYRDVTFQYAHDKSALTGVDFDAFAGERVAVIGASGCGKSSMLKLIPRLYDAHSGRIELDGRALRALQLRSLRQAISFVPQSPVLFQGTLRDNLRHGSPTASAPELEAAVRLARLSDVVSRLPEGLDAPLGPMGDGLSGGEKQRIAIARAILQNRPILILDEATSALDSQTERQLFEAIDTWRGHRIVIVVSHRLSACLWADRVVVFDQGKVIEIGPHHTLNRPGTFYHAFWQNGSAELTPESDHVVS